MVERLRTPGGSDILLPHRLRARRSVPFHWIWLGIILTLLESLNADGTWVSPNILLSFALIRVVRPYAQAFLQRYGWIALAILVCALIALRR